MVRFRVVRALASLQILDPDLPVDRATIDAAIEDALRSAFRDLEWRMAIKRAVDEAPERRSPALELLELLLRDKESDALSRACHLLGLLHPTERLARIHRGLSAKNPKVRASSRELLEHLVRPPLRDPFLALCDDAGDEERLRKAGTFHRPRLLAFEELLEQAVARGGEMESLARYCRDHAASGAPATAIAPTEGGARA
jgi:hypothetical protein